MTEQYDADGEPTFQSDATENQQEEETTEPFYTHQEEQEDTEQEEAQQEDQNHTSAAHSNFAEVADDATVEQAYNEEAQDGADASYGSKPTEVEEEEQAAEEFSSVVPVEQTSAALVKAEDFFEESEHDVGEVSTVTSVLVTPHAPDAALPYNGLSTLDVPPPPEDDDDDFDDLGNGKSIFFTCRSPLNFFLDPDLPRGPVTETDHTAETAEELGVYCFFSIVPRDSDRFLEFFKDSEHGPALDEDNTKDTGKCISTVFRIMLTLCRGILGRK